MYLPLRSQMTNSCQKFHHRKRPTCTAIESLLERLCVSLPFLSLQPLLLIVSIKYSDWKQWICFCFWKTEKFWNFFFAIFYQNSTYLSPMSQYSNFSYWNLSIFKLYKFWFYKQKEEINIFLCPSNFIPVTIVFLVTFSRIFWVIWMCSGSKQFTLLHITHGCLLSIKTTINHWMRF